ncbi:transferase [Leptospira sp. 201903071]|uniref:LIC12162 family transferase n=1 Tax=Leptospira ainazelensis TaxID=2810034 RepID=UPI0019651607|nr:LIC12162 family protein [Leptospira ainazelensis]MBM9501965.1 transferase [Leptospira ainazelensis]
MAHHLITTSDKRTWRSDSPVIFLGEWCKPYHLSDSWSSLDYIVAKPYGLGERKNANYEFSKRVRDQLLVVLLTKLNSIHDVKYDIRSWKIILGHWLNRYVDVLINRYNSLKECIENYEIESTTILRNDDYSLASKDSLSFIWSCNDPVWNNVLFAKLLRFIPNQNIKKVECFFELNKEKNGESKVKRTAKAKVKKVIVSIYEKLSNLFVRRNDSFFISSYFPQFIESILQMRLFQFPKIWRPSSVKIPSKNDSSLRAVLTAEVSQSELEGVPSYFLSLIFELLPICFLEGFREIADQVNGLPWPSRPKFVFTSNCFDTDELFKRWITEKINSGSKYYVGQHGNNYGTYRFNDPTVEEDTADRFIAWGNWANKYRDHEIGFVLKKGKRDVFCDFSGGLLLIEHPLPHMILTWDIYAEHGEYFEEQKRFVSSLDLSIKRNLTIRLHKEFAQRDWSEDARWSDFDSDLKIDLGLTDNQKLIRKSRLTVHSYDSTGILETLSQNLPTLAFWANGYGHLRDNAIPNYRQLQEVGILHLSPESCARHIHSIWHNVSDWWYSDKVQKTRDQFCYEYALTTKRPISRLKEIFES